MFAELTKLGKQIILIGIIITALLSLGNIINYYVDWNKLTTTFAFFRQIIEPINIIIDLETALKLFGYGIIIEIGVWTYKGYMVIINFLNEK